MLQVPGIQPAHASALYAAGFMSPDILVSASESDIAATLAAKLPNMRKRKDKRCKSMATHTESSCLSCCVYEYHVHAAFNELGDRHLLRLTVRAA